MDWSSWAQAGGATNGSVQSVAEDGSSRLLWRPRAGLAKWEAKNCIQWERDRVCHNTADNRRSRDTQL